MPRTPIRIDNADHLPRWRRPEAMLLVMSATVWFGLSLWMVLINNFAVEVVNFDGSDTGWRETVREIPGFLAFLVVFVIRWLREQTLAVLSIFVLGAATAVTSNFPSFWGLLITTYIGSMGFHYFETVNQSLQLQWLSKDEAPRKLGWIVAASSAGSLIAYSAVLAAREILDADFDAMFVVGGGVGMLMAAFCWLAYPQFQGNTVQRRDMVLKWRYWLYYALVFMGGARRQIFIVFAPFMMVEKFGMEVEGLAAIFLINYAAQMLIAPLIGRMIQRYGERLALIIEYVGLFGVFSLYVGVYYFDWEWWVAAVLYIVDHLLFAIAFAQKTYFQKIADPEDQAPTAAVAFTINHIAAVFLPAALGYLWLVSPASVFSLAVGMSLISLVLATMVPRHPRDGHETVWTRPRPAPTPTTTPAE
ncbi:MAG: MFS transporter [Pseudomonadota bacterium]